MAEVHKIPIRKFPLLTATIFQAIRFDKIEILSTGVIFFSKLVWSHLKSGKREATPQSVVDDSSAANSQLTKNQPRLASTPD